MEKTISMTAIEAPLTVKEIVTKLIEIDLQAWKALPDRVRNIIMERPSEFQLGPVIGAATQVPTLTYKGVKLRYDSNRVVWAIDDILS